MKKRYIHKNGETVHVLLQVGMLRGDNDSYVAMVTEIGDIVKDLEKELHVDSEYAKAISQLPEDLGYLLNSYEYISRYKEKNHRKSRHLSNMVHELRTPLNAINGFSSLLKRYLKSYEDKRVGSSIERIAQGCRILDQLIVEILDFEMMEKGTFSLNRDPFDLNSLVKEVVELLWPFAAEHGLEIQEAVNTDIPIYVNGDRNRILLVFNNLISNAIKYTETGSVRVEIDLQKDKSSVCIHITDTGIGIAEKDFEALFDEFKKVRTKINKKVDSIGLGLPIAKKITEMHEGTISVVSKIGKGSTFTVTLPICDKPV